MSSGGHPVWLCSPFPGRHPRSIKTEEGPFPSGSYGGHPFTLRQPGGHVTLPQVRWGWGHPSPEPLPPQLSPLSSGLADPVPSAPPAEAAGNSQWPLLQVGAGAVSAPLASLVLAPGTLPHTALHTPCPLDGCLCGRLSPAPGNSVGGRQDGEPGASAACRATSFPLSFPRASNRTWTSSAPNLGREPVALQMGLSYSPQWPRQAVPRPRWSQLEFLPSKPAPSCSPPAWPQLRPQRLSPSPPGTTVPLWAIVPCTSWMSSTSFYKSPKCNEREGGAGEAAPGGGGSSLSVWWVGWSLEAGMGGRAGSSLGASVQGGQQLCLAFDTPCPPSCCPGRQAW